MDRVHTVRELPNRDFTRLDPAGYCSPRSRAGQARRERVLDCPVVRAVRARRRGKRCRVVHRALNHRCGASRVSASCTDNRRERTYVCRGYLRPGRYATRGVAGCGVISARCGETSRAPLRGRRGGYGGEQDIGESCSKFNVEAEAPPGAAENPSRDTAPRMRIQL